MNATVMSIVKSRETKVDSESYIALRLEQWRSAMVKWAVRSATADSIELVVTIFKGCGSKGYLNDVWTLWRAMIEVRQGHLVYEWAELGAVLVEAGEARKKAAFRGVLLSAPELVQLIEAIHATHKQAVAKMSPEKAKEAAQLKRRLLEVMQHERNWKDIVSKDWKHVVKREPRSPKDAKRKHNRKPHLQPQQDKVSSSEQTVTHPQQPMQELHIARKQ